MLRGTITLDISKATEKTPAKSELLDIGGYKWQVRCPEKGNPASFEIECNQNCTADLWLCSAKFSCETRKTGKAKWKHCGTWESLWFNSYAIKAEQFMEMGQRKGLWPNHIRIHIEVLWCAKQSSLPTIDATLKMRFDGDSELDPTNAQLIPINQYVGDFKKVLATHSDFFADLFLNNKNNEGKKFVFDAQKPVYELQESADFDIWRFRFMLHALLVDNNAEKRPILGELKVSWTTGDEKEYKIELLKQAHKYRLKTFVVFVEELLTEMGMSTMEFLQLADEHSLIELKQRCLDKIKPGEFCNELDANIGSRALLGEETRRLLDAKLKE